MTRNKMLYIIVGGSGVPMSGNSSAGGYNGGGFAYTCGAGPHSASGGGMTHLSYTCNVAVASPYVDGKGSWNPAGTIAVAGGGGGQGQGSKAGGGLTSGGASISRDGWSSSVSGSTQTSGWAQGCGQACYNSSAGGGGWWGGMSLASGKRGTFKKQTNGTNCGGGGAGGSGYIAPEANIPGYTNVTLTGGAAGTPAKPDAATSQHGYARVVLIEER